jgi:hypothetical protein
MKRLKEIGMALAVLLALSGFAVAAHDKDDIMADRLSPAALT